MKALIQRVTSASVTVNDAVVGEIGPGFLILLGVAEGDNEEKARYLADKILNLRIFPNAEGKFDKSLIDLKGEALLVSQFTLLADTSKGRRPNFQKAAKPEEARRLYEYMRSLIEGAGIRCATGQFQAHMDVRLCNDGPVTVMVETPG